MSQVELKKLFLVTYEILGMLVNMLTLEDEHSRTIRENLQLPIQRQLYKKLKSLFLLTFYFIFGMYIKFGTFWKKKMSLVAQVFLKLFTLKDVLI